MRYSMRSPVWMMLAAVLALPMTVNAQRRAEFTSFDFPGAATTTAYGINAGGAVVGTYTEASGRIRGFLLQDGKLTAIDYPGAIVTWPFGINDNGEIAGGQSHDPTLPGMGVHGFVLRQGKFTDINYPGHMNTMVSRFTNNGVAVGCYHDTDQGPSMHGMMYSNGTFTALNSGATMHMGVSPDGNVAVGGYNFTDTLTAPLRGYMAGGDTPVLFDFPFAMSTSASDINGYGEVVGIYFDGAGKSHGFLLRMGDAINTFGVDPKAGMTGTFDFTTIDFPGAASTEAWGINSAGDIVGDYIDAAGKTHGYVLNRATRRGQ